MLRPIFIILVLFFAVLPNTSRAHDSHTESIPSRSWKTSQSAEFAKGSFLFQRNGRAFIELENGIVKSIAVDSLSKSDIEFIAAKQAQIDALNTDHVHPSSHKLAHSHFNWTALLSALALAVSIAVFVYVRKTKQLHQKKVLSLGLLAVCGLAFSGFTHQVLRLMQVTSDPNEINQAFTPFVPNVHTFWDANYFWVESRGIPTTHPMMVGISNHGWQRQVPIPQCYLNANAWPIPLNPTIASVSTPVSPTHFTRGAIGIAVNGVPIFNPYTNTGVDAFLDGQLDAYGGHCGRGDDYHYHTAPLHLYNHTEATLPIAYALDGFAVYGEVEPDGNPMLPLDTNNGHFGNNGVYHYHGINQAPYMVARFAGQVTEDATHQLIPQPHAQPVRPGQSPLNGALITACTPNATGNGYTLVYTFAGATDSIVYNWTPNGQYHFSYFSPAGQLDSTFNGFVQCTVPSAVGFSNLSEIDLLLYPNPSSEVFFIKPSDTFNRQTFRSISISTLEGKTLLNYATLPERIETKSWAKGTYFIKIETDSEILTKKIIVP